MRVVVEVTIMNSTISRSRPRAQSGVMLIEALIALLIFSIGVLGIIGLQSTAVKVSGDARYRSEAALLANELIGKMWTSDRTAATLKAAFDSAETSPTAYQAWAWVGTGGTAGTQTAPADGTVFKVLPGAASTPPVVTVKPVTQAYTFNGKPVTVTTSQVTITLSWKAPQETGDTSVHSYIAVAQIGG
jgi:type IV pilus assembly protein PilV